MDVCLLGGRCVFDLIRQLESPAVVPFRAVLGDFPIGFGVKVFRLDCRDISDVSGNMGLWVWFCILLILLGRLIGRHVAHIPSDWALFILDFDHPRIYLLR